MSADPATAFLQVARERNLLPADELDALSRPGGLAPERLAELTARLEASGALTAAEAAQLRAGPPTGLIDTVPLDKPQADALAAMIDDALAGSIGQWPPAGPPPQPPSPEPPAEFPDEAHPLGRVESMETLEGDPPVTAEEAFVPREYAPGESGDAVYGGSPFVPVADSPQALAESAAEVQSLPAADPLVPRNQFWLWLGLGLGLNLLAVGMIALYFFGPLGSSAPTTPAPAKPSRR